MITGRDVLAGLLGVALGPPLWLVALIAVNAIRHGSWTTIVPDQPCNCPKDGRMPRHDRVTGIPADGVWPLRRCPVCGARWIRSYVAAVPGAGRVLGACWTPAPDYTDDEIDARHDAYLRRVGAHG